MCLINVKSDTIIIYIQVSPNVWRRIALLNVNKTIISNSLFTNPPYSLLESVTFLVASRNKLTFDHKHAFFSNECNFCQRQLFHVACCVGSISRDLKLVNIFYYFLYFVINPPIEMLWNPPFEHIWIPLTQRCFALTLEISVVVLDKNILEF